jgi:hypothetical protein
MDAQDFRSLQEAYMEVVMGEEKVSFPFEKVKRQIERNEKEIKQITKNEKQGLMSPNRAPEERSKFRRKNLVMKYHFDKAKSEITADRMRNKNPRFIGKGGKMTKTQREQTDIYDIILSHLLDEGYAETQEAAEVIMVNMSEEWREEIMEGMTMKDFKKNRNKLRQREKRADARSRGHVSKDSWTRGETYDTDSAKRRRSNLTPETRATRHASRRNPDESDSRVMQRDYSGTITKNPKKLRKQKAMGEIPFQKQKKAEKAQEFLEKHPKKKK